MKKGNWMMIIGLLFLGFGVLAFRPVPIPEEKDCLILKGTVSEIYEAGTKDVVVKLNGLDTEFYVNRGLERGLDLEKMRAELTNKEVRIKYPDYWTPLNPTNSMRHVSKIESDGKVIFTELD
ncbi:hypothetical protein [Algoriphagus sp. A40]|uniref:hypothetical protein n=1 Tax=Algoriphagus sp. A40 TaxID=1945863 RepID=UPI000984DC13|nr:hypothetical protein [Algoriphagus sp. A40]OOG73109.1 hypothetical protein B0E43_14430 [Algoriphagus sp. A40]